MFSISAVTIPIAGPVCIGRPGDGDEQPLDWTGLRERLKESWIATTSASNFMVREMAKSEPPPEEGGKLTKMPKCYFYPEVRRRWPKLATSTVNTLEHAVQGKYRKARLDMARGLVSLPSFRYPVPIQVHNATWSVWEDAGGRLLLSFHLGGDRITVRLRGGQDFRRALGGVRKIIKGEALQGELAIYRVSASRGDNRNGDTKATRVMAKMVAWFPIERRAATGAASIVTGGDAFLTMFDADKVQVFRWNRDDLRNRIVAQDDRMQRLREDRKAEKRLRKDREGLFERMQQVSEQQVNYLHSMCHGTSASVVEMLVRRGVATVMYVDQDQSYVPHFPWHKLKTMLQSKCERAGIEFVASGKVASPACEPVEAEV